MHRNKTSVIFTAVFCLSSTLVANPILVGGWNWTNTTGTSHHSGIYESVHHAWKGTPSPIGKGWHLATFTSRKEQDALVHGCGDLQKKLGLGGCQTWFSIDPKNNCTWITGKSWNFKNGAKGRPNDTYGFKSAQYCTGWSKGNGDKWHWNDEGACRNTTGHVVGRAQSVPEPGMMVLFTISILGLTALSGINRKMV